MKSYVEFEIQEGAYDISCPDAQCVKQGVISLSEIEILVTKELLEKHNKFRLNRGECWRMKKMQ
jgi:E3 ubiquitin-protein ligase RNF144